MSRFVLVTVLSCLVLKCHGYGPISNGNPVPTQPSASENSVLNFAAADYGYIKPVAQPQNPNPAEGGYWWLNKKSPFVALTDDNVIVPVKNEITEVKYESNPFLNAAAKESSCGGYNCVAKVPCVEDGYVCAPQYLCQNGVIDKSQLNLISSQSKFCTASSEICCKVTSRCGSNDCYAQSQTVAVIPSYSQVSSVAAPAPSYSQQPAVSIGSTGYNRPEYGSSIAPTAAPSPAPYTGPQNTTPYPGCAAALKCVPDNYCTVEGVMSDLPVVLTKELLESRVPLSECIDLSTGIIGKCCRDPNYKDPWPDHDGGHDHGGDHDHGHGHDHSHEHTEAPQTHYTIKKPIGGYQTKPGAFPANIPYSTEAPRPSPSYSGSGSSGTYQYQVPNTYIPPPSSQVYIPPAQPSVPTQSYLPPTQPTYPPPPPPVPSYIPPQPVPSYNPPTQPPQPVPSYVPPTQPPVSYIPPTQSTYKPPVAPYVPPAPPQTIPSYGSVAQPQVASYVPPQPPQPIGASYYPAPSITLTRQPLNPPLVFASDRVFEKSTVTPIVVSQDYSQCGVRAKDGTEYGEAPWHAVIYSTKNKDLSCGGVIVSENAVLSSAHCLEKTDSESLYVQVGPAANVYKVATVVRHPQYDSTSLSKDLALAILKEPIKFDTYTQKICLPSPQTQTQSYNKECFISTQSDTFNPGTVQKLKVQTFPYKDCEIKLRNTYLGKYFILQDTFTCASTPSESELCQVKSGEPLACNRGDGVFELYGIKSWDLGCQEYKKSAIFSNNDVLWIENSLVAPLEKLLAIEQLLSKEKFKGETLEGVNIQEKPGFALGYGR
ncbi:serine proteinase stubble-like [Planococcus citri]|uniref:serine proteinase stubble-like n=1 Tax=Planococcus citri TaxID=170843 RepID=UPI0031F93870